MNVTERTIHLQATGISGASKTPTKFPILIFDISYALQHITQTDGIMEFEEMTRKGKSCSSQTDLEREQSIPFSESGFNPPLSQSAASKD